MEGYLSLLGVLCEFLKHLGMNSVPYVFVVQHDALILGFILFHRFGFADSELHV
jgi:hypothetical protein